MAYKNNTSEKNATFQQIGMMLQPHKNTTTNERNVVTTQVNLKIFQYMRSMRVLAGHEEITQHDKVGSFGLIFGQNHHLLWPIILKKIKVKSNLVAMAYHRHQSGIQSNGNDHKKLWEQTKR